FGTGTDSYWLYPDRNSRYARSLWYGICHGCSEYPKGNFKGCRSPYGTDPYPFLPAQYRGNQRSRSYWWLYCPSLPAGYWTPSLNIYQHIFSTEEMGTDKG